jgi:hypothetical protein
MAANTDGPKAGTPSSQGGEPIPPPLRHRMETQFGADFSGVRIHTGHNVAALGAVAYTTGSNIHLQPGFQPYGPGGVELLAHELAHVVQQGQVGAVPAPRHTHPQR